MVQKGVSNIGSDAQQPRSHVTGSSAFTVTNKIRQEKEQVAQ
jgi:hypothetical protein